LSPFDLAFHPTALLDRLDQGVAGHGDRSREDSRHLEGPAAAIDRRRHDFTSALDQVCALQPPHAEEAYAVLPAIQPKQQTVATKRVARDEPKLHPSTSANTGRDESSRHDRGQLVTLTRSALGQACTGPSCFCWAASLLR
jgi:hypothetical protein